MEVVILTACFGRQNTLFRPLGSYQIAWYLRQFDYQVQVIDFLHKFTEDQIWKALEKFITKETKILAYAPMISFNDNMDFNLLIEKILLKSKKRWPDLKIIGGGAAAQFFVKEYRNKSLFDTIFIGHAEDTFLAYCNYIVKNGPSVPYEKIEGNNVIRDTVPLPNLENKFDIRNCRHQWAENDFIQPGETLPIELGRGCIFSCKFCQYPYLGKDKDDFTRNLDLVKEEMIKNYDLYKVKNYYMVDDTFNAGRDRTKLFYETMKTLPFQIKYSAYLRLDLIGTWQEQEDILPMSGLTSCFFGIESLNSEAAKLVGKGWQGKNAKDYLPNLYHKIWQKKISPRLGLIVGIPPESFSEMFDTHDWLVSNEMPNWVWEPLYINRDKINVYISEFDKNAENYGFKFINDNGKIIWEHDLYNQRQAKEIQIELINKGKQFQKPAWVQLLEISSYGFDIESYRHQKHLEIEWKPINIGRYKFYTNYYKQLMSY